VGGYAVGYHGYPRATVDMDIWVAVHSENAKKLLEVLQQFGFGSLDLSVDMFLKKDQIIRMGVPPFRIELLTGISGAQFDECYGERIHQTIDGVDVDLISLERLKQNKKASGRHKDLNDLEFLP
jgi:hypothetical protein